MHVFSRSRGAGLSQDKVSDVLYTVNVPTHLNEVHKVICRQLVRAYVFLVILRPSGLQKQPRIWQYSLIMIVIFVGYISASFS